MTDEVGVPVTLAVRVLECVGTAVRVLDCVARLVRVLVRGALFDRVLEGDGVPDLLIERVFVLERVLSASTRRTRVQVSACVCARARACVPLAELLGGTRRDGLTSRETTMAFSITSACASLSQRPTLPSSSARSSSPWHSVMTKVSG